LVITCGDDKIVKVGLFYIRIRHRFFCLGKKVMIFF
jgi:hypothetical protein